MRYFFIVAMLLSLSCGRSNFQGNKQATKSAPKKDSDVQSNHPSIESKAKPEIENSFNLEGKWEENLLAPGNEQICGWINSIEFTKSKIVASQQFYIVGNGGNCEPSSSCTLREEVEYKVAGKDENYNILKIATSSYRSNTQTFSCPAYGGDFKANGILYNEAGVPANELFEIHVQKDDRIELLNPFHTTLYPQQLKAIKSGKGWSGNPYKRVP
jgi:hypothetical protein